LKALDDRALGHITEYFRALSEPLRLKILNALRDKAYNVGELTELLDCSQANVSKHLATLMRHGFVERSAQGTNVFYRIADPLVYQLCELVCGQMAQRFATQAQMLRPATLASRSKRRRGVSATAISGRATRRLRAITAVDSDR
jgi:DNA-binding transcriptional ArsR family regulator